mmetsp:Transcript_21970/g.56483  ORF Transcript_21970/g.56483 Transcript_21970/m.56483 type:complete len:217 (+) Transcript_21970:607-1257(+)
MRLSRIRLRTTQIASWSERLASSTIILLPPRTKMVTALELGQSSITSIRSFVVPNEISRTWPALPSLSAVSSEKRGTMRPPVAIAMSSSSTPPTQRTAGSLFCISRWLASSSKPHWQMTRFAPESFTCFTICKKYCFSASCSSLNVSTSSISSLCLVFGFGGSNGHVRMHIFASLMSLAICWWLISLSRTMPRTSMVSSSLPPTLPSILMRSRFTS